MELSSPVARRLESRPRATRPGAGLRRRGRSRARCRSAITSAGWRHATWLRRGNTGRSISRTSTSRPIFRCWRGRRPARAFVAADHALELGENLSGELRTLAARAGVTLNTVLQAAWGVVLGRHNRTDDVVFGGDRFGAGRRNCRASRKWSGRSSARCRCGCRRAATTRVAALLRELQTAALAGEAHHHLPITDVQALTPLGRELFDHLLVFENYPVDRGLARAASRRGASRASKPTIARTTISI